MDDCCNPVEGLCSTVVSESFITATLTAELEDPDEFIVKLANGQLCINETGCATLKRYTVALEICNADPDMFEIISGVNTVQDFDNNAVGFEVDHDLSGCDTRFAIEFWTKVPSDVCVAGQGQQYLYWLLPCLKNGRIGDFTIENGPLTFTLTADGSSSSTWLQGPYDVVPQDSLGTPGPLLVALPATVPLHVQLTNVPPPTEMCGCQPLVLPS